MDKEAQSIRNIGILAHVDAGKTSVTEQLLALSGTVRQAGSVDDGTARTDWLEVERRRGISVKTALCLHPLAGLSHQSGGYPRSYGFCR